MLEHENLREIETLERTTNWHEISIFLQAGRYQVKQKLGEGAYCVTYLAKDSEQKKLVVIKTLKDQILTESDDANKILTNFKDEALRLYKLTSRRSKEDEISHNIVHFERIFLIKLRDWTLTCIVMEYIEGKTLEDLIKERKNTGLNETKALDYIRQIGKALTFVHKEGLLHRDVTPRNIIIRKDIEQPVLIDFGIARDFILGAIQNQTVAYTAGYAPPEQYDENGERKPFIDVYALAATLYYLLTGEKPVDAPNRKENYPLKEAQQINNEISDNVNKAIVRGMALQASERPQSVQEWLELLTATPKIEIFKFDLLSVDAVGREVKREKGQAQYFTEDLGNGISLEMVTIPDGKFMMGTKDKEIERLLEKFRSEKSISDRFRRERPQHEVTIQSFLMSKYLITQAQWRRVAALPKVNWDLKDDPSKFKGDNRPVERVSWYDAVEFCDRLNRFVERRFSKYTNKEYRLPSEAEWEYAARAGTTTPFHFGETITTELVNYDGSYTYASAPKGEFRQQTTEVGSFLPNGFGLYDMHGNVWEWCQDTWHDNYRKAPSDGSAWVDNNHRLHVVVRGGCWHCFPDYCRSAYRIDHLSMDGNDNIGFRVVCAAPTTMTPIGDAL